MGRVRQVSLDPRRAKRVFECLYYHGKDLWVGCREMVCSTLSHLRGHRNMPWERRSADTTYPNFAHLPDDLKLGNNVWLSAYGPHNWGYVAQLTPQQNRLT